MRINPKTYPAYQQLQSDESIYQLQLDTEFKFNDVESVMNLCKGIRDIYKQVKHRYYITKPFKEALDKAYPKIIKDLKHLEYSKPDAGVFFQETGFTLYLINPIDKNLKAVFYGFTKDTLTSIAFFLMDGSVVGSWITKTGNDKEALNGWAHTMLATYYFVNECETDQVVVAPGKKNNTTKNDPTRLFNETSQPITVLDCRWFTEIIRNEPFWVTGHWRWQPYGAGMTKRRMKWIGEFKKQGYHREATKDNLEL